MKALYKVADVLEYEQAHLHDLCLNSWQSRTLHALRKCRTSALGGHIDKCNKCNKTHLFYHSCRNRHCPTCQGHKVEEWIQAREKELLPVPYFHVVFTVPEALNKIAIYKPKEVYDILFKTAWQTLQQFGDNPKLLGAKIGMISILHTWGQNLSLHPHLHCIIPAGGVTKAENWKHSKRNKKTKRNDFLFNVKAMSFVFRAKFVAELRKEIPDLPQSFYDKLFKHEWVVFAKKPFRNTATVIEYLGRYTHKIAISNYRIKHIDYVNEMVTFSMKDYRNSGKKTIKTLSIKEFIRRFSLHILPRGFTRIRHFGILSSAWKKVKLPQLQKELGKKVLDKKNDSTEVTATFLGRCPSCKKGRLETILKFDPRGPPKEFLIKHRNELKNN